jgi:hypothetical protein
MLLIGGIVVEALAGVLVVVIITVVVMRFMLSVGRLW